MQHKCINTFFTLVLMTVGVSAPAVSAESSPSTLAQLQQTLSSHDVIRGEFEQLRHMSMFKAPLQSNGEFVLTKDKGLLWQQTSPFPVELTLTEQALKQRFGIDKPTVVTADQNPMVFYFSRVFLSLFQGETEQLQQQFAIDWQPAQSSTTWSLVLTPQQAPLNAVFQSITLQGDQFIESLTLTEVRGDVTELNFTEQQTSPSVLSQEEQRAFEQ